MKRLGFYKNMRYSADRARLLANPGLVLGDYKIEDGAEKQFNKDNIDPDVKAATSTTNDKTEEDLEVSPNYLRRFLFRFHKFSFRKTM